MIVDDDRKATAWQRLKERLMNGPSVNMVMGFDLANKEDRTVSMFNHSVWAILFDRQDEVMRMQPKCPACGADQVQIMSWEKPAQWKCRKCRARFEYEPHTVASGREPGL